jgi:lipopolysaccharide cholinephosphotransferase
MNEQKLISVKDFSPEELRKWQLKLLEILVYFRDFCEKHNIKFFLSGGTCIGAIRSKGIIPWDDDVDVVLLREDYDKLISIWNKEADTSRFVCSVSTKEQSSRFPMATIRSVNTTCIYDHSVNDDICHGLKIDVEFLDAVPKGRFSKRLHTLCEGLLGLFRTQRVPKRLPLLRLIESRILFTLLPTSKLKWIVSVLCEKVVTKYNPPKEGDQVRYLLCKPHPYHFFKEVEWVDFEGEKMPVVKEYDKFLRKVYGDYMQLPPEDQRKPATDNLVFYDLDHSYLDYKGKYYCVKK